MFLEVMLKQVHNSKEEFSPMKSIVYTYSTIFDPLGLDSLSEYDEFKLSSISSERELDRVITYFFEGKKLYFILRLKADVDHKYFASAKLLIERLTAQFEHKLTVHKHFVVVFHLDRKDALNGKQQPFSITHMRGWNQIMIDSLQKIRYINFESIMHLTSTELLKHNLTRTQQSLTEIVTNTYLKLNFNEYDPNDKNFKIDERINNVIKLLSENEKIRKIIFDKVNSMTDIDKNWLIEITTDKQLLSLSKDAYHALEEFFGRKIQQAFLQLIYSLEVSGGLQTLLSLVSTEDKEPSIFFKIWVEIFERKDHAQVVIQKNMRNIVKKVHDTHIPFAFKDIMNCFQELEANENIKEYKGILLNLLKKPDDSRYLPTKYQKLEQFEKSIKGSSTLNYIKHLDPLSYEWNLCHESVKTDIGTIFTLYFLNCEEIYGKMVTTLIKDLTTENEFLSESIVNLLSLQKPLRTLIDLHRCLSSHIPNIKDVLNCYNEIKIREKKSPVFENMLRALVKDIYPSKEAVEKTGSWKGYGNQLSNAILHIQIICNELRMVNMDLIKLFTFWRDLIEVCLAANYGENQIHEVINPLIVIQEKIGTEYYIYDEEAFSVCCKIFERLSMERSLDTTPMFLGFFSRYFVDSYKKTQDPHSRIELIKKALDYKFLIPFLGSFLELILKDVNIGFTNEDLLTFENQGILTILNEELKKGDKNNELSIHLDFILSKFHIAEYFDTLKEDSSKISQNCIPNLWNELERSKNGEMTIEIIGVLGILKYLIGEYTESLINPSIIDPNNVGSESVLTPDDCQEIDTILSKEPDAIAASLRVYAAKSLCTKADDLQPIIENHLNRKWISDLKMVQNEQKKLVSSGVKAKSIVNHSGLIPQFDKTLQNYNNEKVYETSMTNFIKELDNMEENSLCLLSFIYTHVYWKYLNDEVAMSVFAPEKFQKQLGAVRVKILQKLAKNFDKKYKLLHLSPSQSLERIRMNSIICHLSLGIISKTLKSKKPNVFSFLLENDSFEGLADRISKSFIPGAESEEHLPLQSDDSDLEKYKSISSEECSCGFVYYSTASADMSAAKVSCPCCKNVINNPIRHRYGSDSGQFSKNKTGEYLLPQKMETISRRDYSVRALKPLTYRVLSLIIQSLLYFVLASEGITEDELCRVLRLEPNTNCEKLLRGYIELHWKFIAEQLDLQENVYLFLHKAIDQLIEIQSNERKFQKKIERDVWEMEFENDVLDPLVKIADEIVSRHEEAQNTKKIVQALKEEKSLDNSVIVALDRNDSKSSSDQYPYIHLMQIPRSHTFEYFEDAFRRLYQQKEFPLTDLYLKFKAPLECISSLKPIISFTNKLSAQFHLRRLRQEAKDQTIKRFIETLPTDIREEMKAEFKAFLIAWKRICLILPWKDSQQIITYSDDSRVISLLFHDLDNQEDYAIKMACQHLSQIQNAILQYITGNQKFLSKYPHLKPDSFPKTQIQEADEGNFLLGIEISKQIEKVIEFTSYADTNDKSQSRLTYNWNAVEDSLARDLLVGKSSFNCDKIRVTQFKGELPKDPNTDIVHAVAVNIPQRALAPSEMIPLIKLKSKGTEGIENIYTSLSLILVLLTESKIKGHLTLEAVCKRISLESLPYNIAADDDLKDIKIDSLIQLYEQVEEMIYPEIEARYIQYFNDGLRSDIKGLIKSSECQNLLEIVLKGLQKFVVRYLDESLDRKQELKQNLIQKEGLWPKEKFEDIKRLIEVAFPNEILVANTITVIRRITKYFQEKKRNQEEAYREMTSVRNRNDPSAVKERPRVQDREDNFLD